MQTNPTSAAKGDAAEYRVCRKLLSMGFQDVRLTERRAPFDLLVDGYPVEVKYSQRQQDGCWSFHLRQKPSPYPVLAYVMCLDGVPGAADWVYLVIPGPLRAKAFVATNESLQDAAKHLPLIENWAALQPDPYPLESRPIPERTCHDIALTEDEVPRFLRMYARLARNKFLTLAEQIGIPLAQIDDVIEGRTPPNPVLLYALGARVSVGDFL